MYVTFDPATPHVALDFTETLDVLATLLAARRGSPLSVGVNQSGHTRELIEAEQRELSERIRELQELSGRAP